jgi:fengycin family lipopeptide synthetase D
MNTNQVFHQLSESQKSIWYLEKAYPGTSLNIVAGNLRLKGEVLYPALEKALNIFVKTNDSMRLRITENDGIAMQYVSEYGELKIDFIDFSKGGGLKDLFLWDEGKTRTPFNIIENALFYCALYKISDEEGGIYMKMHHLISDAWTIGLATKQVIDLYTKICNSQPVDQTPKPSFIEHLMSEAEYEKSVRFENDREYWSKKFETLPEMTVLKPQKANNNTISARRKTLITPLKLSLKIREFCAANNVSVFTLFMSALSIYINRVTGIEDIILGTTILNRVNSKEKETTGMFVSVAAPVRISVDDSMDFRTFTKSMLKENTDVLRHQKYPYNYIIRDLKKKHRISNRLFDIVLSYQNSKYHLNETDTQYTVKWISPGYQVESLTISVNDREDTGNLIIDYDFLTDVFDIKEIEFIHQHIISLLWHALDNPGKNISKLEMISEKEKYTILHEFNNTYADYPRDKTIHQMFEQQAEKTPENTALIFNDMSMSYAELNAKANALARMLRDKGVGPDKIVAIMTYRCFEMVIGILGILKAGGAYLPIDPDYPAERKNYMIKNSCTGILLTQRDLMGSTDFNGLKIDLGDPCSYSEDVTNPPRNNGPRDLAYVIYTSGSTGEPKGVMVEHSGVINRINWMLKKYPFSRDSVIMQKTTYSFDVSVWELFSWFFIGASLCVLNSGDEKDPEAIINTIEKNKVTALHFVPSMLFAFLSYVDSKGCVSRLTSLVNIFASGEALTVRQVELFNQLLYAKNKTQLSNLYGPTEATVEVSYFECSPMPQLSAVPIGKPIDNINLYIFDNKQNLLPAGIPGELYIGGVGVARGYLYNPDLTSEKFIINPYKRNEILYRTGDRVRWYPKGDIEFLGRMDYQVKIRGFRIELGEIEAKLLLHGSIREAAVKPFTDENSQTYLTAYIVADSDINPDNIRSYLSASLPDYMVPASYVFLDKMPLSSNGKADRNALLKPDIIIINNTQYTPPANETESILTEIWCGVLGLARIGVLDEYSALGGDSLNAIRIITEIHKAFWIDMSPRNIFVMQTIRRLSDRITALSNEKTDFIHIPKIQENTCYELSSAQKRLYILNKIDGGVSYNLPGVLVIEGAADKKTFEDIFNTITRRHEVLRTSFEIRDGRPVQIIHDHIDITIDYDKVYKADYDDLMETFVQPFDLSQAPLFRIKLVGLSERKHLLMFDMHHIISDGASVNILIREITELLSASVLPELTIQYKDFSAWHNTRIQSEDMKKHEAYWLEQFTGEIPVLSMPLDYIRPAFQSFKGDKLRFTIDETLTARIKKLTARTGTTLFMLLLSAYKVLLAKYTGQEDIIVGTPVEGRLHDDVRDLIGMFVNTLPLRSHPEGEKRFDTYLQENKDSLLNAFDHQEYPFEVLVEKICSVRDTSRNPLFDTTFVLQNMALKKFNAGGLVMKPYGFNNKTAKFDLTLEAADKGSTIECTFEYCTELFEEGTIKRLSSHFLNLLSEIVETPEAKIRDINVLPLDERRQLLAEFNDTDAAYPQNKTLHQLFEEQVKRTPDNIALIFQDKKMTYAELNDKANRLARTLRDSGVGPDKVVGIMLYRSFEMMIGIFGILKAGGAYMPINPDYPAERKKYMLENSGARILLTRQEAADITDSQCTVIDLSHESSYSDNGENLPDINNASDLAYIIYTSGSTGDPKGVMIRHTSVVNRLYWMQKKYPLNEKSIILQKTTYTFDVSVWELFWWSFAGASACLIQSGDEKNPEAILNAISGHHVTTMHFVPSMLGVFLEYVKEKKAGSMLSSLTMVFASGEALALSQVELFNQLLYVTNGTKLTNLYGPTEAAIDVTYFDCSPMPERHLVPIGKPIDNIKLYVLDKFEKLVPLGVAGELYIGGVGVGKGYVNNISLTDERFLPNSYANGEKYYKTGDSVKWNKYGEVEFLGRMDFQVKVRGFRIELGEIESRMLQLDGVKEAVVLGRDDKNGIMQLYAYYIADGFIEPNDLKISLSRFLPDYMIPNYFIKLNEMPHSGNGKIDRKRLPDIEERKTPGVLASPETEIQKQVAAAWEEALGVQDIGLYDNFFDLGGNSLSAIKVFSKLDHDTSITELYRYPVLFDFAEKLSLGSKVGDTLLVNLSKKCRNTKTNIICFPYGGGNVYSYKELSDSLDKKADNFALYAVNLPGHDMGRNDELKSIETVSLDIAKQIKENITGEIILYSHCVGCALLIETARLLEKEHIKIKAIYIGGIFPPQLIGIYGRIYKPWSKKSEETIRSFLLNIGIPAEVFENERYTQMMIRAFKHDSQGFSEYFYRHRKPEQKLNTAINCIIGDKDTTTKHYKRKYTGWNRYADSVNLITLHNANHYFVNTHANEIADYIVNE